MIMLICLYVVADLPILCSLQPMWCSKYGNGNQRGKETQKTKVFSDFLVWLAFFYHLTHHKKIFVPLWVFGVSTKSGQQNTNESEIDAHTLQNIHFRNNILIICFRLWKIIVKIYGLLDRTLQRFLWILYGFYIVCGVDRDVDSILQA